MLFVEVLKMVGSWPNKTYSTVKKVYEEYVLLYGLVKFIFL